MRKLDESDLSKLNDFQKTLEKLKSVKEEEQRLATINTTFAGEVDKPKELREKVNKDKMEKIDKIDKIDKYLSIIKVFNDTKNKKITLGTGNSEELNNSFFSRFFKKRPPNPPIFFNTFCREIEIFIKKEGEIYGEKSIKKDKDDSSGFKIIEFDEFIKSNNPS